MRAARGGPKLPVIRMWNTDMPAIVQISFRNMAPSPAAEERVRDRVAALEKFYDRIISCHVVLEEPHRHHHQGKIFHVRVELIVPGREIVVRRDPGEHHAHEDMHVAIRDAFDAVRRQLEDYVRRIDDRTKTHEEAPPPAND
jgi:ribosomal subunit interface protein